MQIQSETDAFCYMIRKTKTGTKESIAGNCIKTASTKSFVNSKSVFSGMYTTAKNMFGKEIMGQRNKVVFGRKL